MGLESGKTGAGAESEWRRMKMKTDREKEKENELYGCRENRHVCQVRD